MPHPTMNLGEFYSKGENLVIIWGHTCRQTNSTSEIDTDLSMEKLWTTPFKPVFLAYSFVICKISMIGMGTFGHLANPNLLDSPDL